MEAAPHCPTVFSQIQILSPLYLLIRPHRGTLLKEFSDHRIFNFTTN